MYAVSFTTVGTKILLVSVIKKRQRCNKPPKMLFLQAAETIDTSAHVPVQLLPTFAQGMLRSHALCCANFVVAHLFHNSMVVCLDEKAGRANAAFLLAALNHWLSVMSFRHGRAPFKRRCSA